MSENTTSLDLVEPSEIASTGAIEQIERASVDIQIATAKRYPRSLATVKQKMTTFATLDEETAAGCFYTLPPRKGGDGKPIQGPSVRLAEIALAAYGHIRAGTQIVSDDGRFITARAVVHDLENNIAIIREVRRRVTTKNGARYSDDMIAVTGSAACSIALRNALFTVIPGALIRPVYEKAKALAFGDIKSLVSRRAGALEQFAKIGISKERVYATLGIKGDEDFTLEHLEILTGYKNALRDKEATIEEIFPEAKKESAGALKGGLAAAVGATPEKKEPEAPAATASETKAETKA